MTDFNQDNLGIPKWAFAYGSPLCKGVIKSIPNDFYVDEQLPFQPEGIGEHVFLHIEKCSENTEYVARLIARFAGVRQRDVGYAGLKDRHARTRQWFSVWLPGKDDPDWQLMETENIKIIQAVRHARKLKRGVLSGNHFQILIRQWKGDKDYLESQLHSINKQGFPNYFGNQRFGYQGQNIERVMSVFQGKKVKREQKSIYLSAARSFLFNQLLDARIKVNNWNRAIQGDCLIFDQSQSYFKCEHIDDGILQRIKTGEIHPTGMMFGKGQAETSGDSYALEHLVIKMHQELANGLINFDLKSDRRALRVFARNLRWKFLTDSELMLYFFLPAGSYATTLIREVINITSNT